MLASYVKVLFRFRHLAFAWGTASSPQTPIFHFPNGLAGEWIFERKGGQGTNQAIKQSIYQSISQCLGLIRSHARMSACCSLAASRPSAWLSVTPCMQWDMQHNYRHPHCTLWSGALRYCSAANSGRVGGALSDMVTPCGHTLLGPLAFMIHLGNFKTPDPQEDFIICGWYHLVPSI